LRSKNIEYIEKIDHLRWFAALLVILFHCVLLFEKPNIVTAQTIYDCPLTRIASEGYIGVALFMTLSGFLFARICHDKNINLWNFYRNRLLRIYPLFLFVLLMACSLDPLRNDFLSLFRSVFLMHNLKNAVFFPQFTEVLWTVPVEVQFYAIFPFLLIFYRKFGLKYLFALIGLTLGTKIAVYWFTGSVFMMAYTTIFGRIDQFVVGMILGFSYDKLKKYFESPLAFFALLSLTILGIWCCVTPPGGPDTTKSAWWILRNLIEGTVFGVLILSYLATSFRLPSRLSRLLAFGGALSFSLYVDHFFFLRSGGHFYIPLVYGHHSRYPLLCQLAAWLQVHPIANILCFALFVELPLTIVAAVLTYFVIEKPFLSLRIEYTIDPGERAVSQPVLTHAR
jgi:peptidoglycan/LPS O-acetylase OafA/YrhL